jgi:hypothetical protein
VMPYIRQAHGLGKSSSWTDIGPEGQAQGSAAQYQNVPWSKESQGAPEAPVVKPKAPRPLTPSEKRKEVWRFVQKVGPAVGTVGGAIWGVRKGLKGGELASKVLEGVGTGTLIGAVPSMMDEGVEALQRLRQKTAALLKRAEDGDHGIQDRYDFQGLPIAIENAAGTKREGTDRDGHHWETKMKHDYGFIEGSEAKDGDAVDVYVGPKEDAPAAFVVHQHKPDGTGFDEDKVMLGFGSKQEAKAAYLKHYDDPKFLGPIDKVSVDRLRELVQSKKRLAKITG